MNSPDSAAAHVASQDPAKMASQPLSSIEMVHLMSHQRPLQEVENAALAQLPIADKQVVMCIHFPSEGSNQGIGVVTVSSLADIEVAFQKRQQCGKLSEYRSSITRDEVLRKMYFMAALNAMNAGLLQVLQSDEALFARARQMLETAQANFMKHGKPWFECAPAHADSASLWPMFLETVYSESGCRATSHRLFMVVRGFDPEQLLLDSLRRLAAYLARRFCEEKSHIHGLGHEPSDIDIHDLPANNDGAQPAEEGLEPPRMIRTKGLGSPDELPFYRKYGIDWSETPLYRRNNLRSIMTHWELSLMGSIKIHFDRIGITRRDIEDLFYKEWEGDVLMYRYKEASHGGSASDQEGMLINDQNARELYKVRKFDKTRHLSKEYQLRDWKLCGQYDRTTGTLKSFQPAYLFPGHILTSWTTSESDTTQMYVGNYFRLPGDDGAAFQAVAGAANIVRGRPTQPLDELYDAAIDQCSASVKRTVCDAPASHAMVASLLFSDAANTPSDIGARFKGFPHVDRVQVMSPESTMPWRLPLTILPPAKTKDIFSEWIDEATSRTQFHDEAIKSDHYGQISYLYNTFSAGIRFALPRTEADMTLTMSPIARTVLFGTSNQLSSMVKDRNRCLQTLSAVDLSQLLAARLLMRYIIITSSGMIRYWKISPSHGSTVEHGQATFDQPETAIDISWDVLHSGLPGFFDSEPESVAQDQVSVAVWEDMLAKGKELLQLRDKHLAQNLSARLFPIELSHFVRGIRRASAVLPWKTFDKLQRHKQQRFAKQEELHAIVYGDQLSLDGSGEHHQDAASQSARRSYIEQQTTQRSETMLSHRNVTFVPNVAESEYVQADTGSGELIAHNGWYQVGALRVRNRRPVVMLRHETSWQDMVGDYHLNHSSLTSKLVRPLEVFCCRLTHAAKSNSQMRSKDAQAYINHLLQSTTLAIKLCHSIFSGFTFANMRPLFARPRDLTKPPQHYDCLLSDTFGTILSQWNSIIGRATSTWRIPFTSAVGKWKNIKTSHECMLAHQSSTFSAMGVGSTGTSQMSSLMHLLRETELTSLVLGRTLATLQNINLLMSGATAIGKSTLVLKSFELLVPGTYCSATSTSKQAMTVRDNYDGMIMYLDEGKAALSGDKKTGDKDEENDWKAMLSNGEIERILCNVDNKKSAEKLRTQLMIIASHRRQFILNCNDVTMNMQAPLRKRFLETLVASVFSEEQQPLEYSFQAYAAQKAAADEQAKSSATGSVSFFWKMHHAVKGILEISVYSGLLRVYTQTAVDYAHRVLAPFKAFLDYDGGMTRVHTQLCLLVRSHIVSHAAYCVLMDWYVHYAINGRSGSEPKIPLDFLITRARRYLFATAAMVTYCASLIFRGFIDNQSHVDIALGFIESMNKSADPKDLHFSLVPLGTAEERALGTADLMRNSKTPATATTATNSNGGDSEPEQHLEYLLWSDDPVAMARQSKPGKAAMALDMTYVELGKGVSEKKILEKMSRAMPQSGKYGVNQLLTAINDMKQRYITLTEATEQNSKHAALYDSILKEQAQLRFGAYFNQHRNTSGRDPNGIDDIADAATAGGDYDLDYRAPTNSAAAASSSVNIDMLRNKRNVYANGNDDILDFGNQSQHHQRTIGVTAPPVITSASLKYAALLQLPMHRYKLGEKLPICKVVYDNNAKDRSPKCTLLISYQFLQDVMKTTSNEAKHGQLPVASMMLQKLAVILAATSCLPAYPKFIYSPMINEAVRMADSEPNANYVIRETTVSSYVLNGSCEHVEKRVSNAVSSLFEKYGSNQNPKLVETLRGLGRKLSREGATLSAQAPLDIVYNHSAELTLINMSSTGDTAPVLTPLYHLLVSKDLPQTFDCGKMLHQPLERNVALIAEGMRINFAINQALKKLPFSLDWESYLMYCSLQKPAADPFDPRNYQALPFCYFPGFEEYILSSGMVSADTCKRLALDHNPPTELYPHVDVEFQLKMRVYSVFYVEFSKCQVAMSEYRPARHRMATLSEWLQLFVAAINSELSQQVM